MQVLLYATYPNALTHVPPTFPYSTDAIEITGMTDIANALAYEWMYFPLLSSADMLSTAMKMRTAYTNDATTKAPSTSNITSLCAWENWKSEVQTWLIIVLSYWQ